jgi:flagellar biosynthesis GTPase FlhF
MIRLTENQLYSVVRDAVMSLLDEAQTLTARKIQSQDNRTTFNRDEVLKQAMSYPTIEDLYHDRILFQKLRYHGLLDYVKNEFAKAGKYKGRGKRGPSANYPKWTPQSALSYASNFLNGYELRENPQDPVRGRSCFHYLRNRDLEGNVVPRTDKTTPRLISLAFKEARKKDAENASMVLANREERKQREREQWEQDAPKRAAERAEKLAKQKQETAARREQRKAFHKKQVALNKERRDAEKARAKAEKARQTKKEIERYVAENGIKSRMELYNNNYRYYLLAVNLGMMEQLFGKRNQGMAHRRARTAMFNKAKTPGHLERRFPELSKELRAPYSNLLKRRFPGWKLVNGEWVKDKNT